MPEQGRDQVLPPVTEIFTCALSSKQFQTSVEDRGVITRDPKKSAVTHHVADQTKARARNQAQERTIIPVGMVNWSGLDQEFLREQFHFVQHPFAFHMRVAHLMRVPLANCNFGGDTRCTCLERSALSRGE